MPDLFSIPGPWPGNLAIVTRPRGGDWLEDEALGWQRAGLNLIVSALEPDEADSLQLSGERIAAQSHGLQFISCPIPDRSIPASLPTVLDTLEKILLSLNHGKNVAVHCRQGVGRSGLLVASALILMGVDADQAAHIISQARGVPTPETAAQMDWLRQLTPASNYP